MLEKFSEWSSVPDLNLLLRAIKSSFEWGACFSAMMGASKAGSLSFNDTCLVTTAIHQNVLELCWSRYLIVKIKMYICFATLYVHCVFYKSLCNPWVSFFLFQSHHQNMTSSTLSFEPQYINSQPLHNLFTLNRTVRVHT